VKRKKKKKSTEKGKRKLEDEIKIDVPYNKQVEQ
jgi:hypothetical protein